MGPSCLQLISVSVRQFLIHIPIFTFGIFVIRNANKSNFYSGDGHLSPYRLAFHPVIWLLDRRGLEFCYGMELLLSYGYVMRTAFPLSLVS
jgi:hypothetical protein